MDNKDKLIDILLMILVKWLLELDVWGINDYILDADDVVKSYLSNIPNFDTIHIKTTTDDYKSILLDSKDDDELKKKFLDILDKYRLER